MKACKDCVHSAPRKPRQTRLEAYEADTRPERPTGFREALRGFWSGWQHLLQYRNNGYGHPYDDDLLPGWYESMDRTELERRENYVKCTVFPKHREVRKTHYCGHFQVKELCDEDHDKSNGNPQWTTNRKND